MNTDIRNIFESYRPVREGVEHAESNLNNPEEAKEVAIGSAIIDIARQLQSTPENRDLINGIISKAEELIKMHSKTPDLTKLNPEERRYVKTGGGNIH